MSNNVFKTNIKRFIYLMMMLSWMLIIFYFSNQPGSISSAQSSSVKDLILNSFSSSSAIVNYINNSGYVMFLIRKMAHMFLYFVLTVLAYLLSSSRTKEFSKNIKIAMFIAVIYAAIDEIHQLYVIGRSGMLTDVWIDSIGVFVAILMISIIKVYKTKVK